MIVLIMTANQGIIRQFNPKINFKESTTHTCTFQITKNNFDKLYNWAKNSGYNPYALMSW